MRTALSLVCLPILAFTACKGAEDGASGTDEASTQEAIGSYDIDPESGEITASHTDATGVTTTLRAGENVEPRFPEPFTRYPGMTVTNTTRVERGESAFVTVEFTSPDPRETIVAFYRAQAEVAGIDPDIEIDGGQTTTLGGEHSRQKFSFALQVTRIDGQTEGQLSVASGID